MKVKQRLSLCAHLSWDYGNTPVDGDDQLAIRVPHDPSSDIPRRVFGNHLRGVFVPSEEMAESVQVQYLLMLASSPSFHNPIVIPNFQTSGVEHTYVDHLIISNHQTRFKYGV
jgi:hypothetical protein